MTETSLQDRLRDHAKAFDGLLSLIPAKMYYGEDTSDQWNKKKQTKAEARAARRGKLDPDSKLNRNAKEVMDERARNKRKLQEMQEDEPSNDDQEDDESVEGVQRERPGEGLRKKSEVQTAKKQKTAEDGEMDVEKSARQKAREERRLLKLEKKAEKKRQKADTGDNADATAPPVEAGQGVASVTADPVEKPQQPREDNVQDSRTAPSTEVEDEDGLSRDRGEMAPLDVSGLVSKEDNELPSHTSTPNSGLGSPVFDTVTAIKNASVESASTTTSLSSTVPPSERPRHIKVPTDTSALRIRLAAKIEALRAARKADGADGRPIRTRQELIESRREKQAQRKAHKKEMRQLAKAEEERKREEALASARNSPGGALSPMIDLGDDEKASTYFAFGRVAFADGTQMSHDLSYTKGGGKKKGPSDPKTALAKLEAQKKRIAGLDEDKRKEVLEKETWLAARRRAEGSKVHDDEALLKKAVKRKERSKKKSENEWKERTKGVENAIKERQRKREDNIRKRKEDKMLGKAGKKKAGKAAKRNRAGFEGSFGGRRPR